ncbi:transmembrane amino acid transporter protein-domain-containing protein [Rhodotorula diobovata]|uniref:Transmembrane amino acid transporter protein-domain-containing protein n=1 Tax=Rhodotorula diobovata TaxID=5288 RepID=A0A5C5G4U0_9BASI|nr:transmembrane amino acid transporter protein-domain-containing protein [Rhodotorula diobovata]
MGFRRSSAAAGDLSQAEKAALTKREAAADKVKLTSVDEDGGSADSVDGVFGEQGEGTVNYRSVGWKTTVIFLIKSQIGVGVLGLPSAFSTLGLVPGILVFALFASATMWTDLEIGLFKLNHPQVYSISDCGTLMFGKWCGELFGAAYWLFCTFTCGSALLTISTAFNALSLHAICTAAWVAIAAAIVWPFASLQTLHKLTFLGWIAVASILVAIFTVVIAVGVSDRPAAAPPAPEPYELGLVAFGNPSFADGMNAVSAIFFAFTGTSSFLPIASEMRNPRDYPKAVITGQSFVTIIYFVVAVTVYCTAGIWVASPALGTAGTLIKRIAYGISLPGLIFSAIMYTHLPAKLIFVRVLRGSHHLNHGTRTHWIVWLSCTAGCLIFSYIIASAIPVFSGLVGLIGALPAPIITLHAEALMWLYDNSAFFSNVDYRTRRKWCGVILNCGLLVIATFLTVAGTYGSIVSIANSSKTRPWTCADNSGSS